jgi:hypothetical protein
MQFRTLGELRAIVLARLGMGGMGASGGANGALVNSFLENGQRQLYELQDWKHLVDYYDITTGVDQNLYDYPTTGAMASAGCAQFQRVLRIETEVNNCWTQLREGISTDMWATMGTNSQPCRYERYKQILVYPKADAAYKLRVWFVADLGSFSQDTDRATLDDSMILLHALTNAKAHYRQPDAQVYQGQLDTLLGGIRGRSIGSNSVFRRGEPPAADPKPAVVGRDVP